MTGRLGALAAAMSAEVQRRSLRAFLIALGAGMLAVFGLGASFLPDAFTTNLLLAYGLFVAAFGLALALLLIQGFGGAFGDALAVAGWARLDAESRRKAAGGGRIPRSAHEARAWLADHADSSTVPAHRFSAQILAGELAAARQTLAAYPSTTALERFEILDDGWLLEFLEGRVGDLAPLDAAARNLPTDEERTFAAVAIATLRAHVAAIAGSNWIEPLAAERARVAGRADGIVGARYVVAGWTLTMALTSVMVGFALLVGRATGVWGLG